MPIILRQLIWILSRRAEFRLLGIVFLLHFVLFWCVLAMTEVPGSNILDPINYWYFWTSTSTSIGYGDLSPQSPGGRLLTPFFQITGIAILTIFITLIIQTILDFSSKRRRGLMPTSKRGHILVLGDYHPIQTKTLIRNAVTDVLDDGAKIAVVGCFRNTHDKNPFDRHSDYPSVHPEYVQVNGAGFNRQVLEDAGALTASQIFITASDDATSIGIVGFLSRMGCAGRIVLLLHEEENMDGVPGTNLDLHIIPPVQAILAVREMGDPGTSTAVIELLSSGGSTIYSVLLACDVSYGTVQNAFGTLFRKTVLLGFSRATTDGTWTPSLAGVDASEQLFSGDRLIYMASKDLSSNEEGTLKQLLLA